MENITFDLGCFEYLNEALEALSRQEQRYDEVIVVDTVVDGRKLYGLLGANNT